jgi:hypothetical protein
MMMDTKLTRVLSRGFQDAIDPLLVVDVPLHRIVYAVFEIAGRLPSKFVRYFGMIDRISPIMTQTIGHEGN